MAIDNVDFDARYRRGVEHQRLGTRRWQAGHFHLARYSFWRAWRADRRCAWATAQFLLADVRFELAPAPSRTRRTLRLAAKMLKQMLSEATPPEVYRQLGSIYEALAELDDNDERRRQTDLFLHHHYLERAQQAAERPLDHRPAPSRPQPGALQMPPVR